jgi:membrane protein
MKTMTKRPLDRQEEGPRPALSTLQKRTGPLLDRAGRWRDLLDDPQGGWFYQFVGAAGQTLEHRASLTAAATAYFTLFSLFPLILLTVALASFWFDPAEVELEIVGQLEYVVPALGDLLGANMAAIVRERGAVTGLSVLALIWSASSVFYVLSRALDRMWASANSRPAWQHRGLAIGIVLLSSITLIVYQLFSAIVLPILYRLTPEELRSLASYLGQLLPPVINVVLFAALYYFLPQVRLNRQDVIQGAVAAGLLWELAKRAFLLLVSTLLTGSNLVYGSLATITAFLIWAYVSSLIFLYGGHVNVRRRRRQLQQAAPGT